MLHITINGKLKTGLNKTWTGPGSSTLLHVLHEYLTGNSCGPVVVLQYRRGVLKITAGRGPCGVHGLIST